MLLTTQETTFSPLPLVLDLDGTVLHTDTFHEMMASLLLQSPWTLLQLPFWFLKGRAYAKAQLTKSVDLNLETLPYNHHLLSFAREEREKGRPLILATGSDQKLAQKISNYLGIFQEVIGSDGKINMTGYQKGQALVDRFGIHGFDYAGDSPVDAAVWRVSRKALVIYPKRGVLKRAQALKTPENILYLPREKKRSLALFTALRPLFWCLNLVASSINLFIGLSLLSSALLMINDLYLLEKERKGKKKGSVFAQGHLHLNTAFVMAPLLLLSSFFFMFFTSVEVIYIGTYIFLFIGLDRLTRNIHQPLRWALLSLFQGLTVLFLSFKL